MKKETVVLECVLNAPVSKVWKAITDPDQFKHWYFDISSFKPTVGQRFSFTGGDKDRVFVHRCQVTEVIPEQKIAYTWAYEDYPGESVVSFELFPEGDKTKLILRHEGLQSFPQDDQSFAASSFNAGWTHIIGSGLKNHIEALV